MQINPCIDIHRFWLCCAAQCLCLGWPLTSPQFSFTSVWIVTQAWVWCSSFWYWWKLCSLHQQSCPLVCWGKTHELWHKGVSGDLLSTKAMPGRNSVSFGCWCWLCSLNFLSSDFSYIGFLESWWLFCQQLFLGLLESTVFWIEGVSRGLTP